MPAPTAAGRTGVGEMQLAEPDIGKACLQKLPCKAEKCDVIGSAQVDFLIKQQIMCLSFYSSHTLHLQNVSSQQLLTPKR